MLLNLGRRAGASLAVFGLMLAPAAVADAQAPGGCGTPAVPAVPADPGAPGGGATPAQPAIPAKPAKCPDSAAKKGGAVLGSSQTRRPSSSGATRSSGSNRATAAGPDGVLGTADDGRASFANTGFGGTAGGSPLEALPFVAGSALLGAGAFVLRRRARAIQA